MADDVIEFAPFLKRKRASECTHPSFNVGMNTASVTCQDCDAELDPWWVLRQMVLRSEEWDRGASARQAWHEAKFQEWNESVREAVLKHEAWVKYANEQKKRLTADWNRLMAEKLRLANDPELNKARAERKSRRVKGVTR